MERPERQSTESVIVRAATPEDVDAWRALWRGYCRFYETHVPADVRDEAWRRILDPREPHRAILATSGGAGEVIGFANFLLHPITWSLAPACYLEDLFVAPSQRRRGIGHALIGHLIELKEREGWARLYWHTRADNDRARRLYDRFAPTDGFIRYTLESETLS